MIYYLLLATGKIKNKQHIFIMQQTIYILFC